MTKSQEIKSLYLSGKSITDISKVCNVSRATIYRHKARDLKEGIDWDALALNKTRDTTKVKHSEEQFLLALIQGFEENLKAIKDKPHLEQLEVLKEYASTYYKLKAPLQTDCKAIALQAVSKALSFMADLAKKQKSSTVGNFLADNADEILSRVLK